MYRRIESESSLRVGTVLVILAVLASAMAVLFMLHAGTDDSSALQIVDSGDCGDDIVWTYYHNGQLGVYGTGEMYDYSKTNAPWSEYSSDITKIAIDNNITSLGEWAFRDCTNLKELSIPITLNSVRSNEHPAFAGCTNIERIRLTYGTNGYGCWYAAYATDGCWYQNTPWYQSRDSLKELTLADGIVGIGSDTFRELNITSLVLPDSLTIVGDHCFFNCTKLTELTYPISLKPFCNKDYPAFQGCNAIEKVTFTKGNGDPYDYSFGLFLHLGYPSGTDLAPWNMNSGVAKTITISDDIVYLGEYMFRGTNIQKLTIPVSVKYISSWAFFAPYNNLESVSITKGDGGVFDNESGDHLERCPWYKSPNIKSIVVEEGVRALGYRTFEEVSTANLVLPNTLESFGKGHVFDKCRIKNLTIPITLNATWIDVYSESAFYEVSGIEKITFTPGDSGNGFNYSIYPGNNCWYQETPWYECRSTLREIVFEDGIKTIGSDAFRELNITSVVISDSVQTLGNHTFYHCDKLTDLTIPISLDSVYSYTWPAFDQCNAITTLMLTSGETGIGWNYLEDHLPIWCNPLHKASKIIFDSGISYIGSHTLEGFTFADSDGFALKPTADNLSGYTFSNGSPNPFVVRATNSIWVLSRDSSSAVAEL